MKTIIRTALLAIGLFAGQAAAQEGVGAFGLALGKASVADIKAAAQVRGASAQFQGTNKFSDGPMYGVPAAAFGMDGLQEVTFIFDPQERLAATLLKMGKHRFDAVFANLRGKYAVREQQIPFVGNRYVRLGAPGATIEIIAPHLSFEMDVIYQRDDFVAAHKRITQQEAQQKARREREQL